MRIFIFAFILIFNKSSLYSVTSDSRIQDWSLSDFIENWSMSGSYEKKSILDTLMHINYPSPFGSKDSILFFVTKEFIDSTNWESPKLDVSFKRLVIQKKFVFGKYIKVYTQMVYEFIHDKIDSFTKSQIFRSFILLRLFNLEYGAYYEKKAETNGKLNIKLCEYSVPYNKPEDFVDSLMTSPDYLFLSCYPELGNINLEPLLDCNNAIDEKLIRFIELTLLITSPTPNLKPCIMRLILHN